MERLKYLFLWLSRIGHCRGFGIQSPTDYWLVRYVINEHWPYYQYDHLGEGDDWLTHKLGRLYFRLANWRQPAVIETDGYGAYFQAGCRKASLGGNGVRLELGRLTLDGDYRGRLEAILQRVDERSVLIVEHIWRDRAFWRSLVADERTGTAFDLYYCGIVLFDRQRHKQHYVINF